MSTELDNHLRAFAEGRISRRELLKRATALGVAAALPAALLAKEAQAATPKRGGRLRLGSGHGSTADSIDPSLFTSGYATLLCSAYLNRLTEVNSKGELVPELAESWEPSGDATEWSFALRKGVEFHNGKTLDAEDVITTINYHRGADSKSAVNSIANQIVEIRKDGDHRVTFRLDEGNADFPVLLSAVPFGMMPAKDGELAPTAGIGTGGYVVEEFTPGVRSLLKRNPNYFREDKAFFDSVEMVVILDTTARQNALITDAVDVIDNVDLKTVQLFRQNDGIEVIDVTGTLHYTFPMRTDMAPFDNNDVRLALKHAINREELLQKILHGYGALGNDHPISPSNRYYVSDLPQRPYDPDKARYHLKKAGMENLKVELSASDAIFTGAVDAVVLYREHAAKAGIEIVAKREPNDGYWSDVWMKKPWCAAWWYGRPTADWMFSEGYAADANWNDTFWRHDRFNELLTTARAELDPAKRREMYGEMQRIVSDEGGALVPLFANYVMAHSKKIAHADEIAGNLDLDGGKAIERWWFA
jgi:peptide/nickel transport system substrate-binding protein